MVGFPNNFLKKFHQTLTSWEYDILQNISVLWEFVHSQTLGIAQFPINSKSVRKSRSWELSCAFSHLFCTMGIHSSHALGIVWKSASRKILKKPLTLKCLCFPIIFSFHLSYVFGIVGIFALFEIFKKLIILECCCFSILFPYCVNSLFPCFGNYMDFCFVRNIWETQNFGMFLFFDPFPLLWEFTFPMFWELYGFRLQATDVRNP